MLNILIWLCGALVVAGAIAWDMQALRVNRVGWPSWAWWCASVIAWPVAGPAYLLVRPRVRRELVASVWHYVGGERTSPSLRRLRLLALHRHDLVAQAIFDECLKEIEAQGVEGDGQE